MATQPEKLPVLRDDLIRLEHIMIAAGDAVALCAGRGREELDSNMMLRRAVVNAIQEIGEAAARITDQTRVQAPEIPWGSIVQMRNIVVHVCWRINLDLAWDVVNADLPVLLKTVQSIIDRADPYEEN